MKNKVVTYLESVPKYVWILIGVILIGIFLRTYNFQNWMVFNPDQARDAMLVQNMLNGKEFPFLGPQAGNTKFKLGPIFYYFEFASAKIFGASAAAMAYPDLFTSILSLPLMFFFARKFFSRNVALAAATLYAFSYFMIYYSRFAFNPNSIPFYTLLFLYSLLEIIEAKGKEKFLWASALGLAMGIGFQLHALLFVTMPIVALAALGYMFYKRQFVWKSAIVAILFFILANTGQLVGEFKSGFANTKDFFSGATSSSESADGNFLRNVSYDVICQIQGNTYAATALGGGDKCDIMKITNQVQKKGLASNINKILIDVFGTIFLMGGIWLLAIKIKKTKDEQKRIAFSLAAFYVAILFLVFLPVSSGISIRYYIAQAFFPFLLLGLWLEWMLEKTQRKFEMSVIVVFAGIFVLINLVSVYQTAKAYQTKNGSTVDNGIYQEVEQMSNYILQNSQGSKEIYLAGKRQYLQRFGEPLQYFGAKVGVDIGKVKGANKIKAGKPLFYVSKKLSKKGVMPVLLENHATEEFKNFGNIGISKLAN